MNIFDKIRTTFQNFDSNTALSSIMATVASLTVDNFMSILYLILAAGTFMHNMKMAKLKADLEAKKVEAEIRRVNLETDRLEIDNKTVALSNDRFEKETIKQNTNV